MGRRMVMRHGLRVKRNRSKYITWQTPLLATTLCLVAVYTLLPEQWNASRKAARQAQRAQQAPQGRQLAENVVSLDAYTNNDTEWCAFSNVSYGRYGAFDTGCPEPTCEVEVPVDYSDEASPYYPKNPNRSSTSYMSNYVVVLDLNTTGDELVGCDPPRVCAPGMFSYVNLRRIKLMEDNWFGHTAVDDPEFLAYKAFLRNDWFYNKADIVQYAYATDKQIEDAGGADLRISGPGGKAVYGRWFGPVGVKRELYQPDPLEPPEAVDVVPGSRQGCQGDEADICLEPPLEFRVCIDPKGAAPESDECKAWLKHEPESDRRNIRVCELPTGDYPNDMFSYDAKRKGAIAFHIFIICLMFIGIAIVCDEFFEPALQEICEFLSLKDDVAGATFMAAGGSAPELFTSIMGVFIAKNDIGFGTIVGSAVFNVLFVIAMCAFVCPGLQLSYWPLVRDSSYYCFSILLLVFFILDEKVKLHESCILFFFYLFYVLVMKWNEDMEKIVDKKLTESYDLERLGKTRGQIREMVDSVYVTAFVYLCILANIIVIFVEPLEDSDEITGYEIANYFFCAVFIAEFIFKIVGHSFFGYWRDPMNAFDGILVIMIGVEIALAGGANAGAFRSVRIIRFFKTMRGLRVVRLYRLLKTKSANAQTQWVEGDWEKEFPTRHPSFKSGIHAAPKTEIAAVMKLSRSRSRRTLARSKSQIAKGEQGSFLGSAKVEPTIEPQVEKGGDDSAAATAVAETSEAKGTEKEEEEEEEDDEPFDPFDFGDKTPMDFLVVGVSMPLRLGMFVTIPDCRRESMKKLFPVAFFMCIVWIAAYSYIMVWMAVQFGCVTGIPDPVMGLTLLAAGTSIPDALSSLAVAKKGHGDMAVSSSIGSNIFDILFGLAVPWMLGTAVTGSCMTPIIIRSSSMAIMVLTLFIMVAVMIMCIVFAGWKLTRKLGVMYLTLYVLFVTESLLLEYKIIFAG